MLDYEQNTANDPEFRWEPSRKLCGRRSDLILAKRRTACCTRRPWSAQNREYSACLFLARFKYSPLGSFSVSYGPEGFLWERNDNGDPVAADDVLTRIRRVFRTIAGIRVKYPSGSGYGTCSTEVYRPNGDRILEIQRYWNDYSYDGIYEWRQV